MQVNTEAGVEGFRGVRQLGAADAVDSCREMTGVGLNNGEDNLPNPCSGLIIFKGCAGWRD